MISDIDTRRARWRRFLDRTTAPHHLFIVRPAAGLDFPNRPVLKWENSAARIEWAWKRYLREMDITAMYEDDYLPRLWVSSGTEIFAEAFGCKVHWPDDDMPFALPRINNATEVASIKVPTLAETKLPILFDIADELKRRAPTALLGICDSQSPMDIAAQIWDKASLCIAILEEPEAVRELSLKIYELYTEFWDEWFRRYGTEYVAHYPDYMMTQGLTLSEDEVGIVKPAVFRELFLPELSALSARYKGLGIHCCANSRHQWEGFKEIPYLRFLNIVQPPDTMMAAYGFFAEHTCQMHNNGETGPYDTWPAQYPANSRVVIQPPARDIDDARRVSDHMLTLLGRTNSMAI
jgi:hypothetical protein